MNFKVKKKALPELKLLQIGVSKEKGYAIQVDKIGPNTVFTSKIKLSTILFSFLKFCLTYTPLPPRALVYAVFDVLSVIALHESTLNHETVENHYWPYTITKTESPKTIDNWHRLRAKGINSPVGGQNIVSSPLANSPKPYCLAF